MLMIGKMDMKINKNYDGASIDIIKIGDNEAILSLIKEKDEYSFYYNFSVNNDSNDESYIYIENFSNSMYFNSDKINVPFFKTLYGNWQRFDDNFFLLMVHGLL